MVAVADCSGRKTHIQATARPTTTLMTVVMMPVVPVAEQPPGVMQ